MQIKAMKLSLILFISITSVLSLKAQKQLVLLKRESVVARFTEGEYLRCKLKNKEKREGKILALTETQIITTNDTLSISSIESLNMKGRRKVNVMSGIGGLLFVTGIGYMALDQLNSLIGRGAKGFDEQVALTSLALTSAGAALLFIRSPYKKVYGHTFKTIDYTSRYYKLD